MSELQYPFVNVPPIVYNQPLATLHESSGAYEAYSNYQPTEMSILPPKLVSKQDGPITFVPANENGEMVAIQGTYFHPRQHVLTNDSFSSPMKYNNPSTKSNRCDPKTPGCDLKQQQQQSESNPELAKYYVAGLSVVGLVILYRFMSRTQY